jgi:hypothetical protein
MPSVVAAITESDTLSFAGTEFETFCPRSKRVKTTPGKTGEMFDPEVVLAGSCASALDTDGQLEALKELSETVGLSTV